MELTFYQEDVDLQWSMEKQIDHLIPKIVSNELGINPGDLSIIFCSDEYLLDINLRYLNHDYYTDIITFPYSSSPLSADLYISIDRVQENADLHHFTFNEELCRVIIHGILHLCGYNDKTIPEKKRMTSREDYYLKVLLATGDRKI